MGLSSRPQTFQVQVHQCLYFLFACVCHGNGAVGKAILSILPSQLKSGAAESVPNRFPDLRPSAKGTLLTISLIPEAPMCVLETCLVYFLHCTGQGEVGLEVPVQTAALIVELSCELLSLWTTFSTASTTTFSYRCDISKEIIILGGTAI